MNALLARHSNRPVFYRASLCFALALLFCASASAQTFNFAKDREPVVSLDGKWRFHTGDDPRWASPDFDDSQWKLLWSDESWAEQGYRGYSGFAWYRFHIEFLPTGKPVSLMLPVIETCYQVFSNGILVGSSGSMPPHGYLNISIPQVVNLPPSQVSVQNVTVAIRIWHSPLWSTYNGGGPLTAGAFAGQTGPLISRWQSRRTLALWRQDGLIILSILETLGGFAALALFLLRRSEREYLWFALMLLLGAAQGGLTLYQSFNSTDAARFDVFLTEPVQSLLNLATIAFFYRLLHGRRTWVFWLAVILAPCNLALAIFAITGILSIAATNALTGLCNVPISIWIISLLLRGWRARLPDARVLLVPVILQESYSVFQSLATSTFNAGWQRAIGYRIHLLNQPFRLDLDQLVQAFFLLAVFAALVGRFARTRRDEERLAQEFEAARTLQQVLIPEAIPPVPGFQIATIYKPAQEVGGDFFQIIPITNGALIAIGDVSGKGLPAAMTVSLIVGTLRTLAEYTQQPAELLNGLNRRLLGRGGGFTTCLIARICANGSVLVANAGHLMPYQDGEELATPSNLPLGVSAEERYCELSLQLAPKSRLMFLSDGVVEAKNGHNELFGFERVRVISTQSAQSIADAAQQFGQEDDITVLTITFTAVANEAILA